MSTDTDDPPAITFIVPAHNEEATIGEVLRRLEALSPSSQVIVVDDGSTDKTAEIASSFSHIEVISNPDKCGKGAAIRAALPYITGDIVVIQDADLEYDPANTLTLVDAFHGLDAVAVYGSRMLESRSVRESMSSYVLANRFLSRLTSLLYKTRVTDMETGHKALKTEVLRSLNLRQDGFSIEPEITGKLCKLRYEIYELPVSYHRRTHREGKKLRWWDGLKAVWVLITIRFRASFED